MLTQLGRHVSSIGLTELDSAIVKATYPDGCAPKDKHVATLVELSFGYRAEVNAGQLVSSLSKRLKDADDWQTVMKTLITLHRLLREGHNDTSGHVLRHSLSSGFLDESSPEAWSLSEVSTAYAAYLEIKADLAVEYGYHIERRVHSEGTGWIPGMKPFDMFTLAASALTQLEALVEVCPFKVSHPVPSAACLLLFKDGFQIYTFCSIAVFTILDKFQSWAVRDARVAIAFYKRFARFNEAFRVWTSECVAAHMLTSDLLPEFDSISPHIITTLEAYLAEHSDDEDDDHSVSGVVKLKHVLRTESVPLEAVSPPRRLKKSKSRKSKKPAAPAEDAFADFFGGPPEPSAPRRSRTEPVQAASVESDDFLLSWAAAPTPTPAPQPAAKQPPKALDYDEFFK